MCECHCDYSEEICEELRNHRPFFPAPAFRVYVAHTRDGEFSCKEYPIVGWRVCEASDRFCLHIAQSQPPEIKCLCVVEQCDNVVGFKAVYPSTEFDLEKWTAEQLRKAQKEAE